MQKDTIFWAEKTMGSIQVFEIIELAIVGQSKHWRENYEKNLWGILRSLAYGFSAMVLLFPLFCYEERQKHAL